MWTLPSVTANAGLMRLLISSLKTLSTFFPAGQATRRPRLSYSASLDGNVLMELTDELFFQFPLIVIQNEAQRSEESGIDYEESLKTKILFVGTVLGQSKVDFALGHRSREAYALTHLVPTRHYQCLA